MSEYVNEELEKFNRFLSGKKVAVIGLGVSNKPLIEYLHNLGCDITVFDKREADKIDKDIFKKVIELEINYSIGDNYLSKLRDFDMIFRSPSCRPDLPEIERAVNKGAILTSEIELLMELAPCKIIGVTGSDGKTTTTNLIYEILKQKYRCFLGGNLGVPLFTRINEMTPEDIVILELSSFQLLTMQKSPNIAVITNISPNHLDIHKSYEEYIDAKKNIFKYQNEDDLLVINYDNEITRDFRRIANGRVRLFSRKEKISNGVIYDDGIIKECNDNLRRHIISDKEIKLRGDHNRENICAAIAATKDLVDTDMQVKAISEFKGVEHRLELVRTINDINWYNDSIASSPNRTIAGLNSFNEKIVLLAGGRDKKLDYSIIAKPIIEHVSKLILMGETADKIYNAVTDELEKQGKELPIYRVSTVGEAVQKANKIVEKGEIVLFSPASTSFDMFKNFEERGKKFKEEVNKL